MKKILCIALVLILASVLTIPAMAAERAFNLGEPYVLENGGVVGMWYVDGSDRGAPRGLTPEIMQNCIRIELEMDELEDRSMVISFSAPGSPSPWWEGGPEATYEDGKYVFRLGGGNMAVFFDQTTDEGEGGSIWICDAWWGLQWADHGITKATLIYTSAGGGAAAATGVTSFIALAIGAFLVSGSGAVAVLRKIKK